MGSPSAAHDWLIQLSPLIVLGGIVLLVAIGQLILAPARINGAQGAIIATLYKRRATDEFVELLAKFIERARVLHDLGVSNDEEVAQVSKAFDAVVNESLKAIESYFNKAAAVVLENDFRESFVVKKFRRGISDRHNHFLTLNERYRASMSALIRNLRYTNNWEREHEQR